LLFFLQSHPPGPGPLAAFVCFLAAFQVVVMLDSPSQSVFGELRLSSQPDKHLRRAETNYKVIKFCARMRVYSRED
jgi:hypothetical protein